MTPDKSAPTGVKQDEWFSNEDLDRMLSTFTRAEIAQTYDLSPWEIVKLEYVNEHLKNCLECRLLFNGVATTKEFFRAFRESETIYDWVCEKVYPLLD